VDTSQPALYLPGSLAFNGSDDFFTFSQNNFKFTYEFNGSVGPCRDVNSDGVCDYYLDSWRYQEKLSSSGRFYIPFGMPAHTNIALKNPDLETISYVSEIGPTSGITGPQLHEDKIKINSHYIYGDILYCGSMITGGSYLDANGAGVWTMEMIPCGDTVYPIMLFGELALRSSGNADYRIATFIGELADVFDGVENIEKIYLNQEAGEIKNLYFTGANAVKDKVTLLAPVGTVVSNNGNGLLPGAVIPATPFIKPTNIKNNRVDVGYRCMHPVLDYYYEP
jgi:hypothetical protein